MSTIYNFYFILISAGFLLLAFASIFISNTAEAHTLTIPAGSGPFGITYGLQNHNIYVANAGSGTVSVISSNTNTVSNSILVGRTPVDIVYVPSNNHVYVCNYYSNDVYVIDANRNKVIKAIHVGSFPWGIGYNPSNEYVYVANLGDNSVSVIDTRTDKVVKTVVFTPDPIFRDAVAAYPTHVSYNSAVNGMYVSHELFSRTFTDFYSVAVINGATDLYVNDILVNAQVSSSEPIDEPNDIAFNPFNNDIYVANHQTITVIDGITNLKITDIPIPASGIGLRGIIYNPINHNMYVCSPDDDKIYVIGPQNNVLPEIVVENSPFDLVFNPRNNHLYVTTTDGIKVIHP